MKNALTPKFVEQLRKRRVQSIRDGLHWRGIGKDDWGTQYENFQASVTRQGYGEWKWEVWEDSPEALAKGTETSRQEANRKVAEALAKLMDNKQRSSNPLNPFLSDFGNAATLGAGVAVGSAGASIVMQRVAEKRRKASKAKGAKKNPEENPNRPPKKWMSHLRPEIRAQYPRKSGETDTHYERELNRIIAGIWHKQYDEGTRERLTRRFEGKGSTGMSAMSKNPISHYTARFRMRGVRGELEYSLTANSHSEVRNRVRETFPDAWGHSIEVRKMSKNPKTDANPKELDMAVGVFGNPVTHTANGRPITEDERAYKFTTGGGAVLRNPKRNLKRNPKSKSNLFKEPNAIYSDHSGLYSNGGPRGVLGGGADGVLANPKRRGRRGRRNPDSTSPFFEANSSGLYCPSCGGEFAPGTSGVGDCGACGEAVEVHGGVDRFSPTYQERQRKLLDHEQLRDVYNQTFSATPSTTDLLNIAPLFSPGGVDVAYWAAHDRAMAAVEAAATSMGIRV